MAELNKKIFELTLAIYRVTDIFPKDEVLKRQIREKANEILSDVCEYKSRYRQDEIRLILSRLQVIRTYLGVARFSNLVKAVNTAVLDREYEFFVNFFEREITRLEEVDKSQKIEPVQIPVDLDEVAAFRKNFKEVAVLSTPKHTTNKSKVERSVIYHGHVRSKNNHTEQLNNMPTFAKWTSNGVNSQKVSLGNGNGVYNNRNAAHNGNIQNSIISDGENGLKKHFNERQQTILDYIRTNQQIKSTDLASIFSNKFSIKTLQRDLMALIGGNTIERQGDKRWAVYKIKS